MSRYCRHGIDPITCALCDTDTGRLLPVNPIRIQLSRSKGWRKPPNTIVVSRPSVFGNPFKVLELVKGQKWTLMTLIGLRGHVFWGRKGRGPDPSSDRIAAVRRHAVEWFELWINGDDSRTDVVLPADFKALVREKLRGKNLACWCPLDQPCHADLLLRIANEP